MTAKCLPLGRHRNSPILFDLVECYIRRPTEFERSTLNSPAHKERSLMSLEKPQDGAIEKIYAEASQWVRLANQILWTMGTFLVPFSFTLMGLALSDSA